MAEFEREDALRALHAMKGKRVAILIEGKTSGSSYIAAFRGRLVGPEESPSDPRWLVDDGQEAHRFDATWFSVPEEVTARLSEGSVVLVHRDGEITITADRPLGEDLTEWKESNA